jgi:hypothetical protein
MEAQELAGLRPEASLAFTRPSIVFSDPVEVLF